MEGLLGKMKQMLSLRKAKWEGASVCLGFIFIF